jgi:hypothetical protein
MVAGERLLDVSFSAGCFIFAWLSKVINSF